MHEDFSAINMKQKCEYKMVIKPEAKVLEQPLIQDEGGEPQYIIIDQSNLENIFLLPPTDQPIDNDQMQSEVKFHVGESYQIIETTEENMPSNHQQRLLEGVDESNIIIKTDDGDMVIRNGQLVRLNNLL